MKKAISDGLKKATKAQLIGAGLSFALMLMAGVAAPSTAEELDKDLGIIRACGGDVWRLCKDVLPDVGRIKACVQDKMGQLSKGCLDTLLEAMAGAVIQGLQESDLCALRCGALQCVRRRRLLSVRREARRQHQPAVSNGQGRGRLLDQRRRRQQQIHDQHL